MKHLTVRDLPDDLGRALQAEKGRRGQSLNQTVKDLLRQSLSLGHERSKPYSNGLGKLARGWSEDEFAAFEEATAAFERVDEDLWK